MTGIFFGSTTGSTEAAAAKIAERLGIAPPDVHNVADTPAEKVKEYDLLLLGSSTWGAGLHLFHQYDMPLFYSIPNSL